MATSRYLPAENLNLIISNTQTCIAKLNVGFWYNITPNQIITFTDGEREVDVIIQSLSFFSNFGDAWFTHGEKLIPSSIANIITVGDAIKYYRNHYSSEDTIACGVVVFCFHVNSPVRKL
jgi:hypothetical protein